MSYKHYEKVITTKDYYGECAIYEPHPFRESAIKEAVEQAGYRMSDCKVIGHQLVPNDEWCWVFYDWCGNPVGLSDTKPEGETVEKFTKENLYGNESLAEYLNREPFFENGA